MKEGKILLNAGGEEKVFYTSTGEYVKPEKVRCIEGGDFYDFMIGKYIYQCDECGHTWISDKDLKVGDCCPVCEEGQV